jgi:hypothetical protein
MSFGQNLYPPGISRSNGVLVEGDDIAVKAPYPLQLAMSGVGALITSGTKKGGARVPVSGTITAVNIACSPSDEPSATAVEVDVNKVDKSTGTATSVLSAVATIATGANEGTGTVNGTQSVLVGDWLQFDIDQGSDGALLTVTVYITPS